MLGIRANGGYVLSNKYCDDCEYLSTPFGSDDEICEHTGKLLRWNSMKARGFEIVSPDWCPLKSETGKVFKLSAKYADIMKKYLGK